VFGSSENRKDSWEYSIKMLRISKMRGRCVILPSKTVTKRRLRGSERQKLVSFALSTLGLSPWFLRILFFLF
jgi:hypothetical protein